MPGSDALSYAILVHAALWFPITLVGAIEWSRMHLSLKQVSADENGSAADVTPVSPVDGSGVNETHASIKAA